MPKRYFDLSSDVYVPKRWYLDDPVDAEGSEVDPWQFSEGQPLRITGRLRVPIYKPGRPLDFTTTPVGSTPIVHVKVATLLAELAPSDIQLFPVEIDSQPDQYVLVNTTRVIDCIDDARCEQALRWGPEDGRPEKTGQYRGIIGMRIDPTRVGQARIFRPWSWTVALIVSEDIQQALQRLGVTGTHFQEV
jgi:hypothetical protein